MKKQDRQGVRTPADLERKYPLGNTHSDSRNYTALARQMEQLSTTLAQFIGETKASLNALSEDVRTLSEKVEELANPTVKYSITNDLTNCTNSNTLETIAEGESYSAIIISDEGYYLSSVQVLMDYVDITGSCRVYQGSGTFEMQIESVSGDIIIIAEAE